MDFIFDIGNVLLNFRPQSFLRQVLGDPAEEAKLGEIIFKSPEWGRLDEGTITLREACGNFCEREPRHSGAIARVMERIPEMLTPVPRTSALLPEIKAAGHGLYYLSNYPTELSRYILRKYPFFGLFDGGVFSCDVHLLKPSPQIYRCLLQKYGLDPQNCLFFDDTEENVSAARKLGIDGVLFTDAGVAEEYIRRLRRDPRTSVSR